MQKSIIIIGAGITGLSAGCYAQMNGYRTQIFELGALPGGLCTSWKRNDYTIDGCIHWLVGSSPANYFYRFWEELGAVQGRRMINHEEFARIEGEGGKTVIFYANIHRLEQHLKELAPEDVGVIDEFIKAVRSCTGVNMPIEKAPELYSPTEGLRMLFRIFPHAGFIQKWKKTSTRAFSERIKNTVLREAYRASFGDLPDFPMLGMIMTFAWLHQNTAGYPVGGSLEFSRAIERRYLDLGGDIHYRSPVAKILVKNDMAVGIRLFDGTEHHGDIVVSAADGHTTIFNMLGGQYIDSKIQGHYDNLPIFPPLLYIALGVNRTFNEVPHSVSGTSYLLDKPLTIAGHDHKRLPVHIYNFDPTLAPEGKTVLKVMLGSDYDYWKSLNRDSERYKAEKEQIADRVIALIDQRFPGLAAQVEMRDVATPVTWERNTGNWRGSFEGWLPTTKTLGMNMSKTLPGLENFYMAGQWVEPGGGLPTAAMSGRNITQIICHKDKKPFITTTP